MTASPHFRLFGIPVRVEVMFWLVTGVLGYSLGSAALVLTWIAVVFVSVLVHELGHAIALRAFGQRSAIVLHGFGGLTFSQRKLSRVQSIVVSLAGPLSALVLLGLTSVWVRDGDIGADLARSYTPGGFSLWAVVYLSAYINVWWSLLNLVPIRPLDGGNILTELVGVRPARIASIIFGVAAAGYAFVYEDEFQFAGFFALMLAFLNFRELQGNNAASMFDVEHPDPGRGGGTPRTRASLRSVPNQRPPMAPAAPPTVGGLDPESAASLAWNALRAGDAQLARRTVARASGPVSPFLTATIALLEGQGIDPLVAAYTASPDGPSNLVPAAVAADAGQVLPLAREVLRAGADGVTAATSIQTHLHYGERFEHAAAVGRVVYAAGAPSKAQTAFDVACAWSRAGDAEASLEWLATAIRDGFRAPGLIDNETDLAAARAHPGWAEVRGLL